MSDTPRTVNAIIERIRKEVAHSEAASREGCIGCTHVMLRNEDAMALVGVISKGNAWVPVSERLPSDERGWMHPVLATNGKSIFVETTHPSWWNKNDKRGRGREYDGPTITHWMPLPSAPETK